jgi:hypothetical protein
MPRTLQEIIDHADEIARAFEDYEPDEQDRRPVEPLKHARAAIQARAKAEQAVAQSVREMRESGYTWAVIGSQLGTSAEAARQRYGVPARQVLATGAGVGAKGGRLSGGTHSVESPEWTERDDEQLLRLLEQGTSTPGGPPRASASDSQGRHRAILEALAELPTQDRAVLIALVAEVPPMKVADISKLLGMSPKAIRQSRERALNSLRDHPSIRAMMYEDADPAVRKERG